MRGRRHGERNGERDANTSMNFWDGYKKCWEFCWRASKASEQMNRFVYVDITVSFHRIEHNLISAFSFSFTFTFSMSDASSTKHSAGFTDVVVCIHLYRFMCLIFI